MSVGGWVLRVAVTTSFTFGIAIIAIVSPGSIQGTANAIFSFESDPQQRVISFAFLLVSVAIALAALSERSIRSSVLADLDGEE